MRMDSLDVLFVVFEHRQKGKRLTLVFVCLLHWSFESLVGFLASTDFVVHKRFFIVKKKEKSYIFFFFF